MKILALFSSTETGGNKVFPRCGEQLFYKKILALFSSTKKVLKNPKTKNSVSRYGDHMGFTGFNSQSTLTKYFQTAGGDLMFTLEQGCLSGHSLKIYLHIFNRLVKSRIYYSCKKLPLFS